MIDTIQETYRSSFEHQPEAPAWLAELRRQGFARFTELGFPTTKLENWRYTSTAALAKVAFQPAPVSAPDTKAIVDANRLEGVDLQLVFVNGRFDAAASTTAGLPEGVVVVSLGEALGSHEALVREHLGRYVDAEQQAFAALNTAYLGEGVFVHVPEGVQLSAPIHLLFVAAPGADPVMMHPRVLVVADKGSRLQLIEQYVGTAGASLTNTVAEFAVGEEAEVVHYRLQREGAEAFHIGTLAASQAAGSRLRSFSLSLGAALARHDLGTNLGGKDAWGELNGLYLVKGTQHADFHTTIEHTVPHCASRELFKGVLDGKGHGVFNGRIVVPRDAQKSDSGMTNQNLLLSRDAEIDTKPELEIYADDVKCSHGATVGQLDEESIFYLRARGLSLQEARSLLTLGFALELFEQIDIPAVRSLLDREVLAWLPGGGKE